MPSKGSRGLPKGPSNAGKRIRTKTGPMQECEVFMRLSEEMFGRYSKKNLNLLLRPRHAKYQVGMYGSATSQRRTLGTTGERHESEHVIGFNVYAQPLDRTKGEGKAFELNGLAYLEVKELHRVHPGTGSGAAANTYREQQRAILEQGRLYQEDPASVTPAPTVAPKTVSSAVQLNQLEYAMDLRKREKQGETGISEKDLQIAHVSYEAMILNGPSVSYVTSNAQGMKTTSFQVSQVEKAEMLLGREAAMTGVWPTQLRINEVVKACGLDQIDDKYSGSLFPRRVHKSDDVEHDGGDVEMPGGVNS